MMTTTLSASTLRELERLWDWRLAPQRLRLYLATIDARRWEPDVDVERIRAEALKALGENAND